MAERKDKPPKVKVPKSERPAWMRAGVLAAVGLVIGVAWPSLAGIRIGPELPGSDEDPPSPAPVAPTAETAQSKSVRAPSAPSTDAKVSKEQTVIVGGGDIRRCYDDGDRVEGDCGRLTLDESILPSLEELAACPAAMGLEGELEVGFDIDFEDKEIKVLRGEDGELPGSTVNGIIRCTADYIHDVEPDEIRHEHDRYEVYYTLSFYPPGTALPSEGRDDTPEGESDDERGLAAVTWDTGLVRAEPKTGKVVARLVRGTRVKILGRRKDWYRVKIRSKEGWIYRGALGL